MRTTSTIHLGILDAVPREFHPDGEKTDPEKFVDLFEGISAPMSYTIYETHEGRFPDCFDECDAFLVTGSPCSVYDTYPWIRDLENFVRHAYAEGTPLVGICFGHQLITQALGGKVRLAHDGWMLGLHAINVHRTKHWMSSAAASHPLYFVNQDQVYELPPDAELLAGSESCPNAMYCIGEKLLSLQAHLEQPRSSMLTIARLLRDRYHLDAALIEAAEATIENGEPHADLIAQWISAFLQHAKG